MASLDHEADNLEVHVMVCAQRYDRFNVRLKRVERILIYAGGVCMTSLLGAVSWLLDMVYKLHQQYEPTIPPGM